MASYVQYTSVCRIEQLVRLKNSRKGNPSYLISFKGGFRGRTKANAMFAYAIHDGMDLVTVKYHFTPKGKCIIDDMLEGEYHANA